MAPGLLWGDSGETQLHVFLGGWYLNGEIVRSHVLYFAIARLLYWCLPLQATFAANVTSTLAGAVTIANITWLMATFCRTKTAVACGAALLLLSHTLWTLSTSAEVVTLTTALLSAELILFVKLLETRQPRWLAALMLVNGLGVSNHNFALLMWPVYGVIAIRWWSSWTRPRKRTLLIALGSLVLGMAPVLILGVDDLLARGSLAETLQSFLVGHYGSSVANVSRLSTLVARAGAMAVMNFPTPLVLLAIPGLWTLRRRTHRAVYWLLLGAALAYAVFAARYDVPDQHTFLVPAFLFIALFAGKGIDWLLHRYRGYLLPVVVVLLSFLAPVAYALTPSILQSHAPTIAHLPDRKVPYRNRFAWFLQPWRVGYDGARRYARETLESLPPDAWLVVDTTLAAPLNYVQVADSLRRDVRLDWIYVRQSWFEPMDLESARAAKLAAGLMFVGSDHPAYIPQWLRDLPVRFEPAGHVFHVVPADLTD
jgi:hypothetical protein